MTVTLQLLTPEDLDLVAHIALDPGQEPFAGGPLAIVFEGLGKTAGPGGEYPFAIRAFSEVVGFVMLRAASAIPAWAPPETVTLHNLRVDCAHQGRGYARQAIERAIGWASANVPTAVRMALCVNRRNRHARHLYMACGFVDTGQVHIGVLGPQSIMTFDLPA